MARPGREARSRDESEKKRKRKSSKDKMKNQTEPLSATDQTTFSLLADETRIDPTLSSLFATKSTRVIPQRQSRSVISEAQLVGSINDKESAEDTLLPTESSQNDAPYLLEADDQEHPDVETNKRKRKRKQGDGGDVEDTYMRRLVLEEMKSAEAADNHERSSKRQKPLDEVEVAEDEERQQESEADLDPDSQPTVDAIEPIDEPEDEFSPPPRHETEQSADLELTKAKRTVFLGNVSTSAISSKASRKVLVDHLKSIFESVPKMKDEDPKPAVESIRFRSTPYATAMPKKAAFARKEVMEATTKSTNAYAVYSSAALARECVKTLNGSMVLDRHLRVDSVAHPAAIDNRRCVFVGNLGFVDDESNIQAANDEEEGNKKKRKRKEAADVEEGLWRTFGKCGTVESVRVIRDSATRVGKGFAYVQFADGNAVEAALALNEKKFPPMLPRSLRVTRAKALNRNAKATAGQAREQSGPNGYGRKFSAERAARVGRASKLYGKAGAAQARKPPRVPAPDGVESLNGIKKPETFVFEGHRARSKGGKAGLKLGKKKGVKPTNRSAKRGAAFKAGKKKAQK